MKTQSTSETLEPLTPREQRILALLAAHPGVENLELAGWMKIKEGTLKVYLSRLFDKTNMPNRTALTVWARENHV